MINSRNIAFAVLSASLFFAGEAFAQGEGGQNCNNGETAGARGQANSAAAQGIGPEETAQRMMNNFDEDGDGALNMQELSNGLAALQQSMRRMQMQRGQQMGGQNGNQQQARGRGGSQNQQRGSMQRGQGEDAQGLTSGRGGRGGGQRGGGGAAQRGRGR